MSTTKVLVMLRCNYPLLFYPAPTVGDIVYCRRCEDYRDVVVSEREYSWVCPQCRNYRKQYGADRRGAIRGASKHAQAFTHVVDVYKGPSKVDTIGRHTGQLTIESTISVT